MQFIFMKFEKIKGAITMYFAIIFHAISFWKIAINFFGCSPYFIFFFIAKLLGKVTLKENDRGAWCMQQQEQQQARRIDLLSHYSLWENCRRDDSEIIGKKLHISPIHHDLEFYQKIRSVMPFFSFLRIFIHVHIL